MNSATFLFYAGLNDFLSNGRRSVAFEYHFEGTPSAKDAIEAVGVPHTEVEDIRINDRPAGFGDLLQPGDRVEVYPLGAYGGPGPRVALRPAPPGAGFVL